MNPLYTQLLSLQQNSGESASRFFKTQPGGYSEHDRFLGVSVPTLRKITRDNKNCSIQTIADLLHSPFNEARLLALLLLTQKYQSADREERFALYNFYMDNRGQINNWNLVDSSAPAIVGHFLYKKDTSPLDSLALSPSLWDRRIAIVSTLYFIRHNTFDLTYKIATTLQSDREDLIHKAVGWMLREAGKRNTIELEAYLDTHAALMPRTMLRYAIEKLPPQKQRAYRAL